MQKSYLVENGKSKGDLSFFSSPTGQSEPRREARIMNLLQHDMRIKGQRIDEVQNGERPTALPGYVGSTRPTRGEKKN